MRIIKFIFPLLILCVFSCKNNKTDATTVSHDDFKTIHPNFTLSSSAIEHGVLLDAYKCEKKVNGEENSIPLSWQNVPEGTKSLAIVMYHYPKKDDKTEINSYLLLWNISPKITEIPYKMAKSGIGTWALTKTAIQYRTLLHVHKEKANTNILLRFMPYPKHPVPCLNITL